MDNMDRFASGAGDLPCRPGYELTPEELGWAGANPRRLKQLDCLHLYVFMGWPLELIARRNGVYKSTVKSWIADAQGALREIAIRKGLIE